MNVFFTEGYLNKMNVAEKKICTKDYLTKSNLPSSDYVINPYTGCTHACRYCYARFMKRFTGHTEAWSEFIDIKECKKPVNLPRIKGKSGITRSILKQLVNADCKITIATKSTLILRDIDLLQKVSGLKAALSINTLNEAFRADMDRQFH